LNDRAFFFQDDAMLLPADFPDSEIELGIPRELAKVFTNTDIFEVPPVDNPVSPMINVVSVLPGTKVPAGWQSIPVRYLLVSLSRRYGKKFFAPAILPNGAMIPAFAEGAAQKT